MARTQSSKDYYGILGVSADATETEIRSAYRRLALQWHPDRNPGNPEATERFKEFSEAYGVLMDSSKRFQYDRARKTGMAGDFRYTQDDILRDLFRNPGTAAVFEELAREFERMGLRVDRSYFDRALFGGRTRVTGGIFIVSPFAPVFGLFRLLQTALKNSGAVQPGVRGESLPLRSRLLSGVTRIGKWLLGKGEMESSGRIIGDVTQELQLTASEAVQGGAKKIVIHTGRKTEQVILTIPPGIRPGAKLRLRGKGQPVPDGGRGDLYLLVNVN